MIDDKLKKAEINQLYQFLTDLDQNLLIRFSINASSLYSWIKDGDISDEEDLQDTFSGDIFMGLEEDLLSQLNTNYRKMINICKKYSEGKLEEQEEKTSFESSFKDTKVPFILNKSDFLDIDKLKESTKDYKTYEDEDTIRVDHKKSFYELYSEIEPYYTSFDKHGYEFIVDMNKMIINKFKETYDRIISEFKDNKYNEELIDIISANLEDNSSNIFDCFIEELYTNLADKIEKDINNKVFKKQIIQQ